MKNKIIKLFFCAWLAGAILCVSQARAASVGEIENFTIDPSYDSTGRTAVGATLRQIGEKSLFYVEDIWWNSLTSKSKNETIATIAGLKEEFDKTIYPRMTSVYGIEWSPGIDNDYRITVLVTKMKEGTGGYFNSADEFPRSKSPSSNEREMIYLNAAYLDVVSGRSFLAHEFQHLINFYQKEMLKNMTEEVWLNEARSEYSSTVCGYDSVYVGSNLERRVNEFFRNPSTSLIKWENKTENYGAVSLFMQYLAGRYGEGIITKMMKADDVGIASINYALREAGFTEKFSDVFTNWTIANYVNDCQLGEGQKFCYLNSFLSYSKFHLTPIASNALVVSDGAFFSFADTANDWTAYWYEILPNGSGYNLLINFSNGNQGNFRVPILIYYDDGSKEVKFMGLVNFSGSDLIADFGSRVKAVVIIPSSQTKPSGFSAASQSYPFSFVAKITTANIISSVLPVPTPIPSPSLPWKPNYASGSLIRATNDYKVYVTSGNYKRWIQSPKIFAVYPHLGWQSIISVTPAERDWYLEAWLIRADGDSRVYEINGDLTKHWLNMSVQKFADSGRKWEMVFVVNKAERDLYKTGADVLR